jgi:hypothetical protein
LEWRSSGAGGQKADQKDVQEGLQVHKLSNWESVEVVHGEWCDEVKPHVTKVYLKGWPMYIDVVVGVDVEGLGCEEVGHEGMGCCHGYIAAPWN